MFDPDFAFKYNIKKLKKTKARLSLNSFAFLCRLL